MSAFDFFVGGLIAITGVNATPEPTPGGVYYHTETAAITVGLPDRTGKVWLCPMFASLGDLPDKRLMELKVLEVGSRLQRGDTGDCERAVGTTHWERVR
jgi:hypothetical protein